MSAVRAHPLAALLLGAGVALGHAPFYQPLIALAAIGALLWLTPSAPRKAGLWGFAAGLGYFGLGASWIIHPFLVPGYGALWQGLIAWPLFSAGLALFWAAGFWLGTRLFPHRGHHRIKVAAAWALLDLARMHLLTGFPELPIGGLWISTAVAQSMAWVGVEGLGVLTLLLISLALSHRFGASALLVLAALWLSGNARLSAPNEMSATQIRLVQPNVAQSEKWDPLQAGVFTERLLRMSAAPQPNEILLWPETAIPYTLFAPDRLGDFPLIRTLLEQNITLITGIRRFESGRGYNSLVIASAHSEAIYDKHHLVPFGEYFPFEDLLWRFGLGSLTGARGFARGEGPRSYTAANGDLVGMMNCYESGFPAYARFPGPRPDWIFHATNDGWFGPAAGPLQHLDLARMRAIEQGLPIARAANTGISALIDPYGRLTAQIPLGEQKALSATMPKALPPTIYARAPQLVLWGLFALFLLFCRIDKPKKPRQF